MTFFKRNVLPVIFCLVSITISAYCAYELYLTLYYENPSNLHITNSLILNLLIDYVATFNEMLQVERLIGLGLLAFICELLFSNTLHIFFSRLPLGSIKKYDYFDTSRRGIKYMCKHSVAAISPALIIGFYVVIHIIFYSMYPDNLDVCVRWILPVVIILTLIASIALIASVIKYGGLWGALVKLPLLFTSNICLCTLIGVLIVSFGFMIAFLLLFIIGVIVLFPIVFRLLR